MKIKFDESLETTKVEADFIESARNELSCNESKGCPSARQ